MTLALTFLGAAGTVTRSMFLLDEGPSRVVVDVVHGDPGSSAALAEQLRGCLDSTVVVPRLGERVVLS